MKQIIYPPSTHEDGETQGINVKLDVMSSA